MTKIIFIDRGDTEYDNNLVKPESEAFHLYIASGETTELKPGDRVKFTWILEYFAIQEITVTEDDDPDSLEANAWEKRVEEGHDGGFINITDCNVTDTGIELADD